MDHRNDVPARAPLAFRLQGGIGHLLWYSGLIAVARHCQRRRVTARILAYHHILAPDDVVAPARLSWTMYTDAAAFARQMRYVAHHYRPISLPALVDRIARGERIPPGSVAVTLDDGYHDQLTYALPILRKAALPATVALVAHVDTPAGTWGSGERVATAAQWQAAHVGDASVTLAAHSLTHRDLTACDAATLRSELEGSRRHIRALEGSGDLFCYPGGMHNAAVRAATAAAGYRAALSCTPGANSRHTDPFALRRVLVGGSPDHFVAAQLAGLLDGPAWLYHGLNRLRLPRHRPGTPHRAADVAEQGLPSRCRCVASPPPILPPLPVTGWPCVTIAVPTYNERDTIDRCLRSIVTQDYPHGRLEILVVDGGSTDDTVERATRYTGVRVLPNPARDAESAKEIGLRAATGDLFMYLDADADFAHAGSLRTLVAPLRDDPTLVGSFTRFRARSGAAALERYVNYHPLQLGPLLRHLCIDIDATRLDEREAYTLCCFGAGRVPPVGLCLYRATILRALVVNRPAFRWVDVGVPALLSADGHGHFAYAPHAGIHHGRSVTFRSLITRHRRDATKTYLPRVDEREFRYVEFSSPRSVLHLARWVIRVNLLLPPLLTALRESWRRRDVACLYGFPLAVVETDGVLLTFLCHPQGRVLARRGLAAVGRTLVGMSTDGLRR